MLKSIAAVTLSLSSLAGVGAQPAHMATDVAAEHRIADAGYLVAEGSADPAFRAIWCELLNAC